jgi:eukaryotic-like serine/threonine-protein kinase
VPVRVQGTLLNGRYRVLRHLGSGGMASVLLCQDERLDRLVAVKRLHADQPDDIEQRFVREAKLGASLNHPNLVSVFDTATDDEGVLIIMEYVQGEPLSRALRRGPLAPERVAHMASELGAALDHAHRHGVVHRDVKPGNVLLRDDGVTKLVDLGIATAAGHTRITRSGIVLGTASYMAPEQLEGREVGPAADIYALATVCFEALAGERAHPGRSPMEVAHTIATEPAPDLRERWAGAPPATAELLGRAMARDPGKRPRTAGELGSGLRGTLEEAPQGTAATRRMDWRTAGGAAGPAVPAPRTAAPASGRSPTAPNEVSDREAALRPRGTVVPPRRGTHRPRLLPLALAGVIVALAVATIVIAFGSGGGGDPPSQQDGARPAERPRASEQNRKKPKQRAESEQPAPQAEQPEQQAPAAPAPAPAPAPEEDQPEDEQTAASGPAEGARLNNQGFQLMSEGRYDEAIPILQRAVDSFPPGTSDLNYAYALFNLGQALRLAGRPEEAIPILEQRLEIPNQTGVVRRELELARRAAGRD